MDELKEIECMNFEQIFTKYLFLVSKNQQFMKFPEEAEKI